MSRREEPSASGPDEPAGRGAGPAGDGAWAEGAPVGLRILLGLLAVVLPREVRAQVVGDLVEEWAERRRAEGRERARRWLVRQVAVSFWPALVLRSRGVRGTPERSTTREAFMGGLLQDIRYALRTVRKAPMVSLVVALTLGFGVAANTVVFSVVDGVVLRPFPFPEPERLVGVGTEFPRLGRELTFWENLSPAEYLDIAGARTLRDVVAWDMGNRQVTNGDVTENLFSAFWWGDAFPVLGMQPVVGRGFLREEVEQGGRVAILSHRVWSTRFGSDPNLVGGSVLVNGEPYTVVGVMPPRALIYGTDLWLPMGVSPSVFPRERRQFQVLARLVPGATLQQANAELAGIAARVAADHGVQLPEYEGWRLRALPWTDINVRMLRPAALILVGAVAFVLLLVCANIANLLLARAAARRREFAVRTALGAGRGRVVRQLLTESVVLALIGAVAGVALGYLGVRACVSAMSAFSLPIPGAVAVNGRVLAANALVAVLAGVAFGLVPALRAARLDPQRTLQEEGLGTLGGGRLRLQRAFVGLELALALILLSGGALLAHSFLRLQRVDPGFDAENVLTMRLTLPWERYDGASIEPFFRELVRRLETVPGVAAAATATQFPPLVFLQRRFWLEGAELQDEESLPSAFGTVASPGYFETLGIRVVEGRTFTESDDARAPFVVVMNEAAARRFYPGQSPIGKRLELGAADAEGPWFQVVGVVGSTRNRGLDAAPEPELFASSRQVPGGNQFFLLIRSTGEPRALLPAVRSAVQTLDPQQPVYGIRTVEEAFAEGVAARRISTFVLTLFAAFALLLAGVGIYSLVSYSVSQRTREIGLRIALGAERRDVRRMVVRQMMLPVALGAAAGLLGAVAAGRALSSLLFEVSGTDVLTLTATVALLLCIAALASYVPARRASNLQPVSALRLDRGGSG